MSGNPDFDTYRLSEDHEAIREAVRSVAEDKIAPFAAAVDEEARYPQEAHDALVASDFFAPHVPEEYGGVGADALATCIVIEEVARVCASSSLIPAVNKLGSMPLILAANDDVKNRYLTPLAAGESSFSYGLSEREAGSDTAAMKCRAVRDGDDWVLTGQKSWITNAGVSQYYTVLAVTDPEGQRGNNITAFVVEKSDEGFTFGAKERKLGIKGSPTRELIFDRARIPGDRVVGEVGAGLKIALATLDHTRVTIGAQAVGIAQGALDHALAYVKERRQFGQLVGEFQGVQFMLADMAMATEAASAGGVSAAEGAHSGPTAVHASTAARTALRDQMRMLWEDHIAWTRLAIVTFADESPGFPATAERLLRNQSDIGDAIAPFYGEAAGHQLTALLHDHITIAVEVLGAAKAGDIAGLEAASDRR